jgi:lambda family phage tail tape measure protein
MADFASLGIRIDSSQAKTAQTELEKLAAVGERAQKSISATENAAKKMAKGFDDGQKAVASASRSIDDYIRKLLLTAVTNGKGARETRLLELAVQGATKAQLQAADAAIRMNENYEKGVAIGQRLRVGFIALAAAASAAVIASAKSSIDLLDKLDDLSEKSGISVERLSELRFAGEATGTSFEQLTAGLTKLSREMALAAGGNKEAAAAFSAIGVAVTNSDGSLRNTGDVLADIATKFSGYKDGAAKAALAQELFGRSGADLIPILNQGASGIAALSSEAKQLGAVYSGDVAKSAAEFNDNIAKIKLGAEGLAASLAGPLIGALAKLSGAYLQAKKDGDSFIPTLTAIAQYATLPGQLTLAGQIATGRLFKGRNEENDSELKRLEARSKSLKDTIAKIDAPVVQKPGPKAPKAPKDNSAAQEAKAQLAFDLEDIRKAQDALVNTIANGEKLLEARRSANLVTEKAYWEQKRQFLIQNDAAQQAGLEKEIARLQAEKLTGKEKIDNDRKILDAQSKLAKVRENAAVNLQVLAIKEKDALDQIRIKFEQAEAAAQSYVDTIARQNERELAGMGLGNQNRDIDARRNQREDQFQARKEQLDSQRRANQITSEEYERFLAIEQSAHERSLANDEQYWKKKLEIQGDGIKGAQEGLQNYIDEVNNSFERANKLVTDGLQGFNSSLTDALFDGNLDSFKEFGSRMGKQILSGILEQQITKPIAEWLQGSLKDENSFIGNLIGGLTGSKKTGENWLGALGLGGSGGGAAAGAGAASAAASTTALASSATLATTAISSLAAAASAAAASMGGSSLGGLGGLFGGGGGGGEGDALGALIAMNGWADGGYTGPGSKYQPAGIVHAGEYVVNAENTRRLGVSFLERLNRRGYADGGFVGSIMGGNLTGGAETTNNSKLEVHNHFAAGTDSKTVDQAALKFYRQLQRSQRDA